MEMMLMMWAAKEDGFWALKIKQYHYVHIYTHYTYVRIYIYKHMLHIYLDFSTYSRGPSPMQQMSLAINPELYLVGRNFFSSYSSWVELREDLC